MSMFNPEMMQNLMGNEEIQKMMKDPNIMNNLQNMMGNQDIFKGDGSCPEGEGSCDPSACCPEECADIKIDELENIDIEENRLNIGDKVLTKNLKNDEYNDKKGIIEDILQNGRYVVVFEDEKTAAIKEENLINRFENIENID